MSIKLYDAEVEYLQGDGSSYIDTGVKVANTTQFWVHLKLASATKSFVLGGRVSGGNTQIGVILGNERAYLNWRWGNNAAQSSMTLNAGYYTIDNLSSANKVVSNGVSATATTATFSCNYNVFLFADNNGGTAHDFTTAAQIIYAKFYSNGTKVRDFIPVRVGNVGYMYDRVSGQLFGNSGTGSFVLGPDVAPAAYANEVAFLESWGNQYIDTGIKPSTDTKIELKCLYCKSGAGLTNYGALIGADDRDNAYTLTHSDMANFTFGTSVSKDFANPQTRLLTFDSTASPQSMRVYDEGGSLVTTLTCIRGVFEVNQNLYLFATNRSGTPVYGSNRILYCKIYDGDTLVRDYVPVEYNGTGYMYDKVSGLFFDNKGTGKFLFGSIAKACARSYTRRQLMMEMGRPYDAKIEYLEGTGTQWIDTGYTPVIGDSIYCEFMLVNPLVRNVYQCLYSAGIGDSQVVSLLGYDSKTDKKLAYIRHFSTGYAANLIFNPSVNTWYTLTVTSDGVSTIDNVTTTSRPTAEIDGNEKNLWLWKRRNGTSPFYGSIRRFYIKNNGVMKLDLIPVRVGNVGYMYDKVSGKLFGNAGTGNFILGPDK